MIVRLLCPFLLLVLGRIPTAFAQVGGWPTAEHRSYWMAGQGEITRYKLTQARYGELHEGDAVLIFVSEPFSRAQAVKLDDWEHAGADAVEVLKLNFTKHFLTGIYPYSLMLSSFTPTDEKDPTHPLKLTMTGQEWCGQVFGQLLWREDHFGYQQFSYFEGEDNLRADLPAALTEDELWSRVRLRPDALPTGEFEIVPGLFISRLLHVPLKAEQARGRYLREDELPPAKPGNGSTDPVRGYELAYQSGYDRLLRIYFERAFPFAIVGWEESYSDLAAPPRPRLTTRAERTHTVRIDYWKRHGNEDRRLRSGLGLSTDR